MQKMTVVTGVVLDNETVLTLEDMCEYCGVSVEIVREMVDEGVLEPLATVSSGMQFPARALQRLQTALRLQRDLDINLAGVALALDLLQEIRTLRTRLRVLER
jgi:chaperone modulatory protein CbpM